MGSREVVRRSSSQEVALALAAKTAKAMRTMTGQWGACTAHDVMTVHHVLVHPSVEITT